MEEQERTEWDRAMQALERADAPDAPGRLSAAETAISNRNLVVARRIIAGVVANIALERASSP